MGLRGRPCGLCKHKHRTEIELAIARGVPYRQIEAKYGLSSVQIRTHKQKHMTVDGPIKAAMEMRRKLTNVDIEILKKEETETFFQRLHALRAPMEQLYLQACVDHKYMDATRLSKECREWNDMIGKYLGEIQSGSTTIHNTMILSPEFMQLRNMLMDVLRRFPKAHAAVLTGLHKLEQEHQVDHRLLELPAEVIDDDVLPRTHWKQKLAQRDARA